MSAQDVKMLLAGYDRMRGELQAKDAELAYLNAVLEIYRSVIFQIGPGEAFSLGGEVWQFLSTDEGIDLVKAAPGDSVILNGSFMYACDALDALARDSYSKGISI